jgi:hypothetical protein
VGFEPTAKRGNWVKIDICKKLIDVNDFAFKKLCSCTGHFFYIPVYKYPLKIKVKILH